MFKFFKKKKPSETTETEVAPELEQDIQPETPEAVNPEVAEPKPEPTPEPVQVDAPTPVEAKEKPVPTEVKTDDNEKEGEKLSFSQRLKKGLSKTRAQLGGQLAGIFSSGKIDDETYEDLETILLTSDVGVSATQQLLENLKKRVKRENLQETPALKAALQAELVEMLMPLEKALDIEAHNPYVMMLAGVNGAGKTTTIGKLAKLFQAQGKSVLIAAGDTFRAAAREQLQVWGDRNDVHVVSSDTGDAAAVIFDAVNSAKAKNIDIVIADTAGRLPTQLHLMDEIAKVKRVINKANEGAPHEVLLVLDANTGQNAVSQVKAFDDALGVTGLVLSKLDGTAKGGVIAAIAEARPIPIRYIGVGEAIDDLRPFSANDFVNALFDE